MAAKYHISREGKPALCTASKRPCPRGEHYASEAEAFLNAPAPLPATKSYATAEAKRLTSVDHAELIAALDEQVLLQDEAEDLEWASSPFRSFYEVKNGKKRGTWGERYFKHLMAVGGVKVDRPSSTENDGVFNGRKLEIKTNSSTYTGDKLKVNWAQIRPDQDYEALVGQVITPHEVVYFYVPKEDLVKHIASGDINHHHGGAAAEGGNTYVLSKKVPQWLLSFQKSLPELLEML